MVIFEYVITIVAMVILLVFSVVLVAIVIHYFRSEREYEDNNKPKITVIRTNDNSRYVTVTREPASQSQQCDCSSCIFVKKDFERQKRGLGESPSVRGHDGLTSNFVMNTNDYVAAYLKNALESAITEGVCNNSKFILKAIKLLRNLK